MPPRAASKPPSRAASGSKPPSRAASGAKPASRRPAPNGKASIVDEDVDMVETASVATTQQNGHSVSSTPRSKRSRVSELTDGERKIRRLSGASSISGARVINDVPQPPEPSIPHRACFVFGTGDMGQFGLGPDELDEIPRPKLHTWFEEQIEQGKLSRSGEPGTGGLEVIACGGMHTLAVDEAGQVRSWGINDNAALGRQTVNVADPSNPDEKIPNEELEAYPYVVQSLVDEGFRAVQVAAGDSVSVAVSDKGLVRAWGSFRSNDGILGFDGVPGHPQYQFTPMALPSFSKVQVVGVSCGSDHVLALTATGHVYVWGNGQQNQLGRRIIERRKLNGLEPERLGLRNVVLVSAGMYHSFAVGQDGTVWAWGLNTFHQTGISARRGGNEEMVTVPTQVDALHPSQHDGAKVVQIEGGEHHSLFLFDNGEVWACGRSDAHQVGIAEDHPGFQAVVNRREEARADKQSKLEAAQARVTSAAEGADREQAEKAVASAQAVLAAAMDEYVAEPVRVCFPPIPKSYEVVPDFPAYDKSRPSDNPIAHISAGTRHNLAVSKSGHVYSWGLGVQAQLGLGQEEEAKVPTLVRSKQLRPYSAVAASAGGQHCVLLAQLTNHLNDQ